MRVVSNDAAVTVKVWVSLGAPELMPERLTVCAAAFSLTVKSARVFRVGGWFTGLMVTVKERVTILLLAPPSLTVTVIVAEPLALATGVKEREPMVAGLV